MIEGSSDEDAAYTVGSTTYGSRRNGIAWATAIPTISGTDDTDGVEDNTISYCLVPDSTNVRQFYYKLVDVDDDHAPDDDDDIGYIFYKNSAGTVTRLDATKGITDIKFSIIGNHDNIVQVVVTAEKPVRGTRRANPYMVSVTYTDTVYLRNAQD